VGKDGNAQLGDLGISHLIDATTPGQITLATAGIEGTRRYIPPEILSPDRTIHRRAVPAVDVYGFAITCWEVSSAERSWYSDL
jgi:serine/threonine protein kinase